MWAVDRGAQLKAGREKVPSFQVKQCNTKPWLNVFPHWHLFNGSTDVPSVTPIEKLH